MLYMGIIMWTPDKIQTLKTMWEQKYTATEIGAVLGCSRNAVLGKKHRLKLRDRTIKRDGFKPPQSVFKPVKQKVIPMRKKPAALKKLLDLKQGECRWPIGEDDNLMFCGAPCENTYCVEHMAIAYRKPTKPEVALLRRVR